MQLPNLPRGVFFFFNDTATTEIYTLSLHDALPISADGGSTWNIVPSASGDMGTFVGFASSSVAFAALGFPYPGATVNGVYESTNATRQNPRTFPRSEEHTSELQSRLHLVCRLLLEK